MTTDSCVVDIGVVLGVFFVAVRSVLDKSFDTIVGTVLDRESHQRMTVAFEMLIKYVESDMGIPTVEETQD